MYDLTLVSQNGGWYIDSREVAKLIDKRHDNLLRDIAGYIKTLEKAAALNFEVSDFFLKSSYLDRTGRELPCYLLSKMACELVGNKLIGEKGVLFTAAYVRRFNEMEQRERDEREAAFEAELEALSVVPRRPAPRLGEVNAFSRLIVMGMKALGASPDQVMDFLRDTYEPMGFDLGFDTDAFSKASAPRWYNANGIAAECGMYSLSGRPHGQSLSSRAEDWYICMYA